MFVFPIMALLAGGLGGVFGVGGGMLISPLLLQVGITPEVSCLIHTLYLRFQNFIMSLVSSNHRYRVVQSGRVIVPDQLA